MPRIPKNIVDDIKYRNSIEDVVAAYVTLKRAGSNMVGLCPFHSEKTPSFTVFPGENNFYCFGCGAGGDVISFVMRTENVDYVGALELLAKRANIALPRDDEPSDNGVSRTRILAMNLAAARFFRDCLFSPEGKPGLDYLMSRGLSGAVIKRFGLGYAPDSFGALKSHLSAAGFTEAEMTAGFLCGKSKKTGASFDYFRSRVMFPIIDTSGAVIAFGGRVLDGSLPKYLNTSDTPAFKKSRNLFALNFARSQCRDRLILCEGYMDVIALHEAGFGYSVATLGTALTPEQARIMKRYTNSVIISYDADEAGQRAADRAIGILSEAGLDARVLKMNDAKDPDEFIRKFGKERFENLLSQTKSRFEFNVDRIMAAYDIDSPDDRIKAAKELCAYIASLRSDAEREICAARVAEKLGVSKASIEKDVARQIRINAAKAKKTERGELIRVTARTNDRINTESSLDPGAARLEEIILGMLQLRPENFTAAKKLGLTEDDFTTAFNKRVFVALSQAAEEYGSAEAAPLNESFTPDEVSRITEMKIKRLELTDNGDAVFAEFVSALKRKNEEIKNRSLDLGEYIQKTREIKTGGK